MWTDKTRVRKGHQSHLESPDMGLVNVIWPLGQVKSIEIDKWLLELRTQFAPSAIFPPSSNIQFLKSLKFWGEFIKLYGWSSLPFEPTSPYQEAFKTSFEFNGTLSTFASPL
jgi:hypothetical protein